MKGGAEQLKNQIKALKDYAVKTGMILSGIKEKLK